MAKRRQVEVRADLRFKGRQFTAEVILWAVRWCLMFPSATAISSSCSPTAASPLTSPHEVIRAKCQCMLLPTKMLMQRTTPIGFARDELQFTGPIIHATDHKVCTSSVCMTAVGISREWVHFGSKIWNLFVKPSSSRH